MKRSRAGCSGILIAVTLLLPFCCGAQYPDIMWWYDLDAPSLGSAAVGDIDGDSLPEIVFGCYFNDEHIYALNGEDGSLKWNFFTDGCNDASPSIADVDQDGQLEVIAPASSPSMVYCLNGDSGSVEWSASTGYGNCIDAPPAIDDVDKDGKPEIVLGTFNGNVFCFNGEDGSEAWHVNLGASSAIQSGPNLLDLDRDGDLDVFVSQWGGDYRVYALDGEDGSTIWYSDVPTDHMYHSGSFADIDEDGHPEIAIGCYDSYVYCFNDDSSLAWSYNGPWYVGAPTCMADLDGDGDYEIIYVSWYVAGALHHTGATHLWTFNASSGSFRGCAVADIDGDDTLDVALGCDDGYLQAVHGKNGQLLWEIDLGAHYAQEYDIDHAPVIADFDGDGKLDIFVVGGHAESSQPQNNHGRAYALRAGDGTGPGWPMFRHDLHHSACFDGPLGVSEHAGKDGNVRRSFMRCCPNPCSRSTAITYQVARSGLITIRIYDLSGSPVRTIVNGRKRQGTFSTQWDLRNDRGGMVPAGIYFCSMDSPAASRTVKLTIIE